MKNVVIKYIVLFSIGLMTLCPAHADQEQPIFWNGTWDPACSKCWPSPQTTYNNQCTPKDCMLQGYYHCKPQTPPMVKDNDPRILLLIQSGDCQYVDMRSLPTPKLLAMTPVAERCYILDSLAGARVNQTPPPIDTNIKHRLTYYAMKFIASFDMPGAQTALAMFYDIGFGVPQNRDQATQLYIKAANANNPLAEYALGVRNQFGVTTKKDNNAAIFWFNKVVASKPPAITEEKNTTLQFQYFQTCAKQHIDYLQQSNSSTINK